MMNSAVMNSKEIPVIINAKAGRKSRFALALEALFLRSPTVTREAWWTAGMIKKGIVKAFHDEGIEPWIFVTRTLGDIKKTVRELVARGERLIVIAGGDGTINEAVHGVAGTETALGIIPLGTANTFSIELGIPFSIREAVRVIKQGRVRIVDVGKAGESFFAMGAGLSYDAHVIQKVKPLLKRAMGSLAYIVTGMWESLTYPFPVLKVESEDAGVQTEGYLAIISNARFYGGHFKSAPAAKLDDGLLDVIVMKRKELWHLLKYTSAMRYRDITKLPDVVYFQCRRLKVTSEPKVPVHVDAEIAGETPCIFECIPQALRIVVP